MSDGSSSSRLVNWSTLDTDIISINAMGNDIEITALKSGIANIIAVSADDPSIVANLKIWAYKQGENTKTRFKMITLYTIGFTKKNAQKFFELLKNAGVRKLVDIRINNASQLAGFAKGTDLKFFMKAICNAEYEHITDLAPTKEL